MIRKWERRYALTTEYIIKGVYGKLIKWATGAVYEPALMTTQVVVEHIPAKLPAHIKLIRNLHDDKAILELPRYFDFRIAATELAQRGGHLIDIAGNNSVILITLWVPTQMSLQPLQSLDTSHQRVLFEQALVSTTGYKRVALVLPVPELSEFLSRAQQQGLKVEHIYDY